VSTVDLEGRVYGPVQWRVAEAAVGDFVAVTGDDTGRWVEVAPPGFAAAALFAVAPDLLAEMYDRSVVHGEQTFTWHRPIAIGEPLEVTGTVARVRERGGVYFVTFEMVARDGEGPTLEGRSLFLLSGEAMPVAVASMSRPEPAHSHRGELEEGEVAASRADLVRYAAATRDWNPVHWDHDAAITAGFPGVVVHGLLQAGWALRAAAAGVSDSHHPFGSARFRFRSPLLPGRPAGVSVVAANGQVEVTIADDDTEYLAASIEMANG